MNLPGAYIFYIYKAAKVVVVGMHKNFVFAIL